MKNQQATFVYVVCGASEHIDTLLYSICALKKLSAYDILVVTDSSRNEKPLDLDGIIDIKTPETFDHHQASIFLKTGLHHFLPHGRLYCYLDTDVIALNESVNNIFEQKKGLITFAPDHCRMPQFSPYAVECGCLDQNHAEWNELNSLLEKYYPVPQLVDEGKRGKQNLLRKKFELIKKSRFSMLQMAARYVLPLNTLRLDGDTFYNKRKNFWFDATGEPILFEYPDEVIRQIEANSQWRWSALRRRWISPSRHDIHSLSCNHLQERIRLSFHLDIHDRNWQHWNGGVFLFDNGSHDFMESWHRKTLGIFNYPEWKTRDQGTLIATAWEFGLQDMPTLSKHFNFIADFSNPQLMLSADGRFITDDAFRTKYEPAFIHVFHHFGNKSWEVWNWVEKKLEEQLNPMTTI